MSLQEPPAVPRISHHRVLTGCLALLLLTTAAMLRADDAPAVDTSRGDELVTDYFEKETRKLTEATFDGIETLEDWKARQNEFRAQLLEMLGLDPLPEKTPLEPTVTGTVDHDEFTVERVHFQSRPACTSPVTSTSPRGSKAKPRPSSTSAVTDASRRTASATATRRTISTTVPGSPGTATSA